MTYMWVVRPERFELPASWFVARRSIQLSYGRNITDGNASGRLPGTVQIRLKRSTGPRQGREYYHIDYRWLGEFCGIASSRGCRPHED